MKNSNSWVYVIINRMLTHYLQLTFVRSPKATVRFIMNVRPSAWNNSAPTGRRCMTIDVFFENLTKKIHFSLQFNMKTNLHF
jgi:hypothetical protein